MNSAPVQVDVPSFDSPIGISAVPGRHLGRPALARMQHHSSQVRCECITCGAHAFATPGVRWSGACGNCGETQLRPIADAVEVMPEWARVEATRLSTLRRLAGRGRRHGEPPRLAAAC